MSKHDRKRIREEMLQPLVSGYWEGILNACQELYKDVLNEKTISKALYDYSDSFSRTMGHSHKTILCQALSFGHLNDEALSSPCWNFVDNVAIDMVVSCFASDLGAVSAIWVKAIAAWEGDVANLPKIPGGLVSRKSITSWISQLGQLLGVEPMLKAYFDGIPIEDIIA